jgi:hypothetical protein
MRHAPIPPPRHRWLWRALPLLGLTLTGWGCQQPPYYFYYGYGAPACVPVVPAPAVPVNSGNEPPAEVIEGGTSSSDVPAAAAMVVGSGTSSRVVVSQPDSRPRASWRLKPDPAPVVATTSIEGGIAVPDTNPGGDSTVKR